jgi:protocatechuate 3,4-dioxygenase beta subunit
VRPRKRRTWRAWILIAGAVLVALAFWLWNSNTARTSASSSARPSGVHSGNPFGAQRRTASSSARATHAGSGESHLAEAGYALSGTVHSSAGRLLGGTTVCAVPDPRSCCDVMQCEVTDPQGRFAFSELAAGMTDVLASAPGHVARRQSLGEHAAETLDIALEPGGGAVEGSVLDASGGPIPGALIQLRSSGTTAITSAVLSEADGSFRAYAPEGSIDVVASAEAYSLATRRVRSPARGVTLALAPAASIGGKVVRADSDEPVAGVEISATAVHDPFDLRYLARSGADGTFLLEGLTGGGLFEIQVGGSGWRGASQSISIDVGRVSEPLLLSVLPATSLAGRVTVADEPCSEASVSAVGPASVNARAGASGSVQMPGLWPGRYEVDVHCPGALPHRELLVVGDEPITRHWDLSAGLSIAGRVEDPDGKPLANATVSVTPQDELSEAQAHCSTTAAGEFSCTGLEPGKYTCSLANALGADVVPVWLATESAKDILLRARGHGTIQAHTRPAAGDDSAELRVFARREGELAVQATNRGTGFVFERMPLGLYEVYVGLPAAAGATAIARLQRHGEVIELELEAPPALSIAGRALDESGMPWVDAWVIVEPSDLFARPAFTAEPPTLTGDDGEFALRGLAPGRYDLRAHSAAGAGTLQGVVAGASAVTLRKSRAELASATPPAGP